MINVGEVKLNNTRGNLRPDLDTSDISRSRAETDYYKKKEAQKKEIHNEILRVSLNTRI